MTMLLLKERTEVLYANTWGTFTFLKGTLHNIHKFYKEHFNLYINYHRPCGFATLKTDSKGKTKKVYNIYRTPYEALRSHPEVKKFLKKGVLLEKLDEIAKKESDNECAALMQRAKDELFSAMGISASCGNNNQKLQFPTMFVQLISGSYVD